MKPALLPAFLFSLLLLTVHLPGQTLTDAIEQAHGGEAVRLTEFEVPGALYYFTTPDGSVHKFSRLAGQNLYNGDSGWREDLVDSRTGHKIDKWGWHAPESGYTFPATSPRPNAALHDVPDGSDPAAEKGGNPC